MIQLRDVKLQRWQRGRSCLVCRSTFQPIKHWQRFCGPSCRNVGSTLRKSIALAEWRCLYCGQVGDSIDHIPPLKARINLIALGIANDHTFLEVRACRECNSALSDEGYWTIAERKRFIKRWLATRYRRLLSMPEWEPEELLELGPGLSIYIASSVYKKQALERRLKW